MLFRLRSHRSRRAAKPSKKERGIRTFQGMIPSAGNEASKIEPLLGNRVHRIWVVGYNSPNSLLRRLRVRA